MTFPTTSANRRTLLLFTGLVALVGLIAWPSFVGRMQYARTRAELAAIRDSAAQAELKSVGKMFTTLARIIGPTVVNVTSKKRVTSVADEIAALRGLRPIGKTAEEVGSGVIVERDGVIVTNYHVVANSSEVDVALADGRRFTATLIGADAGTDLAVLRIEAEDLPVATWGDSDTVEPGEMVWAIGNPFGLDRTITYGMSSAATWACCWRRPRPTCSGRWWSPLSRNRRQHSQAFGPETSWCRLTVCRWPNRLVSCSR